MGKPAKERKLSDKEANAFAKVIRISPKKLNLVTGLIRGMKVEDAITQLTFSRKAVALDVKKLLQSAIANAENNHYLDVDRLYISEAIVGKGLVMKRFRARARGRGAKILKRFSNLSITVREREDS